MSGSRKAVTADQPLDRTVTVQVEGLPELLSCSDEVYGLVGTPAELRSWADAVTDLEVTASFMRRRIASRPDARIGEVVMVAVIVTGRIPGPSGSITCRVRLQVYTDSQPLVDAVMALLDAELDLLRQVVDPDAVWAALGVADVAAGASP